MNTKNIFYIGLAVLLIWFIFIERTILPPFIAAAIFAYLFNPVISFFSRRLKLPRTLGIIIVYAFLILVFISLSLLLLSRVSEESMDITHMTNLMITNAKHQIAYLPDWLQPTARDLLINFQKSRFLGLFQPPSLPFFSKAISRVIGFIIFFFSGFYFLKDGETFANKLLSLVPKRYKVDVEILLRKINNVLSGYLRGQVFLIFVVAAALYIALTILGVRFSLTLAIFSGFAEIVPVIGPITAGAVATLVVLLTGTVGFGLSPVQGALMVILIYFIIRHIEDYLVIPHVMEKITKLPPFFIFFAVVAGGHIGGILGLILAVPVAAILRLLLEFALDKVNEEKAS